MPHRGGGTIETWEETADAVIANIEAFLRGERPPGLLDPAGSRD
jgi:lactate dehydrogenase-like 2-hydroxyacid dehydrogenase